MVDAEKYVLGKLFSQSFALTSLAELAAKLNKYIKLKSQESPALVNDKKKELTLIKQRLENLKNSVASGSDSTTIQEEIKRYEKRKQDVTEEMEQLQRREETETLSQSGVFRLIRKVKETLQSDGAPECRNFMNTYIEDILISRKKIKVHLKTPQSQVATEAREEDV